MSEGRKLLFSVLIVVVTLTCVSLWLFMGLRKTKELEQTITQDKGKLEELQGKIAEIPELTREAKKLEGELNVLEKILPNETELNKLFDVLSDFKKKAGLQILRFEPGKERRNARTPEVTSYLKRSYDLDLEGDYFSMIKFVNLLENHNRFIQVDSFSIKQGNTDSPVNDIGLQISTFVYNPKSKPSARPTKTVRRAPARRGGAAPAQTPDVPFSLDEELEQRYVFRDNPDLRDPFTNPLTKHLNPNTLARPESKRILRPDEETRVCEAIDAHLVTAEKLLEDRQLEELQGTLTKTRELMDANFRVPECYRQQFGFGRRAQKLECMLRMARGEDLLKMLKKQEERMAKAFEQGDYESVYDIRDAMKDTVKSAGDRVVQDEFAPVLASGEALCKRADTRREFENVVIDVEATFWAGRKGSRRAAAIINGQTLVEGDVVPRERLKGRTGKTSKGAGTIDADVVISRIERSGITFRYKDELIEKLLDEE